MFFRRKKDKNIAPTNTISTSEVKPAINMTKEASKEDIETVSVIMAALVSELPVGTVRIRSVREVDQDKEAAVAIVAAVLADTQPQTIFKLRSIEEIGG